MKRTRSALLSTLALAALITGCESTPPATQPAAAVETRSPLASKAAPPAATPATASPTTAQSGVTTVDLTAQNASAGAAAAAAVASARRVIYFDFDSFIIKDDFRPTIDVFAKALAADKARRLTVEGHTDERGGSEYNLALGQKRAEAVVKSLALLGASPQQVEAVSFGKERPADAGHDEAAWAKNRRAELKDR
jgi:peptidoglycan-associated lipoprotein